MAVYRIFPEKSSFIYTEQPLANAGKDAILEIGGYPIFDEGHCSRTLIQFSTEQIQDIVDNTINGMDFTANLSLSLATAYELPTEFSIYAYPSYDTWESGVGMYGDSPINKTGVSWTYPTSTQLPGNTWTLPDVVVGVTGSFTDAHTGGGSWYTGSGGINLESTENFRLNQNLDLNLDVTNATKMHYSESIVNNGYIVKLQDSLEFNAERAIKLKYYSVDTNTIYPPCLELKWDDSVYSSSLATLNDSLAVIEVTNMKRAYLDSGKQRFRITARPTYPTRTFTTGSAYLTNYKLPEASYWAVRDEYTKEMVITFDQNYTKISADNKGPYFDMYMDGLEPERYYRIFIKTEIDGSTVAVDTTNVFKVIENGNRY